MYYISLFLSIISLAITIMLAFIDPEAEITKFIGYTDIYITMGVSVVFMIIGIMREKE